MWNLQFHIDPITLIVVIFGAVSVYIGVIRDVRWHTKWIQSHSVEFKKHLEISNALMSEMQVNNATLAQLSQNHSARIDRLERQSDASRESAK